MVVGLLQNILEVLLFCCRLFYHQAIMCEYESVLIWKAISPAIDWAYLASKWCAQRSSWISCRGSLCTELARLYFFSYLLQGFGSYIILWVRWCVSKESLRYVFSFIPNILYVDPKQQSFIERRDIWTPKRFWLQHLHIVTLVPDNWHWCHTLIFW